jgi:HSP20 family molecular chaperone IbpA
MHRSYVLQQKLIIEIDLCSDIDYENLKVDIDKSTKDNVIKIRGERKNIEEKENDTEILLNLVNKREAYKSFELEIRIKKALFYVIKCIEKEINYGILFITFEIKKKKI